MLLCCLTSPLTSSLLNFSVFRGEMRGPLSQISKYSSTVLARPTISRTLSTGQLEEIQLRWLLAGQLAKPHGHVGSASIQVWGLIQLPLCSADSTRDRGWRRGGKDQSKRRCSLPRWLTQIIMLICKVSRCQICHQSCRAMWILNTLLPTQHKASKLNYHFLK